MKRMKFFGVLFSVLSMFGLSSCLDDGEYDYTTMGSGFFRASNVFNTWEFTDEYGYTLYPTNMSEVVEQLNTNDHYIYMMYSWDASTGVTDNNELEVECLTVLPVRRESTAQVEALPEESANAPVISTDASEGYSFGCFRKNVLFVPIRYWINHPSDMTDAEWQNELDAHSFEIYYDENYDPVTSDHVGNNVMVLHLRHNIIDGSEDVERENSYIEYLSVDMTTALERYRDAHNEEEPYEIRIKYDRNVGGSSMDGAFSYLNESGFRYSEYVRWYDNAMSQGN